MSLLRIGAAQIINFMKNAVRLPIAYSNTFSGASPSSEPRAVLVFSRDPVLLLCNEATSILLLATGLRRREVLQLKIELKYSGECSWREGQVRC